MPELAPSERKTYRKTLVLVWLGIVWAYVFLKIITVQFWGFSPLTLLRTQQPIAYLSLGAALVAFGVWGSWLSYKRDRDQTLFVSSVTFLSAIGIMFVAGVA